MEELAQWIRRHYATPFDSDEFEVIADLVNTALPEQEEPVTGPIVAKWLLK